MKISAIYDNISIVSESMPEIGYRSRSATKGQEYELVRLFLESYVSPKKQDQNLKTAIFIEPMIDTGYPDIVIVQYKDVSSLHWAEERGHLSNNHYKVQFEIDRQKRITLSNLAKLLGYEEHDLKHIIADLISAGLVSMQGNSLYRMSYRDYFCIRNIVSIEAKMDKWSVAIEQAVQNTRFSAESYILMSREKCSAAMKERCEGLGIGVFLMNGHIVRSLSAKRQRIPNSYTSFLFNEWIIQIERMEGEK